MATLEAFMAKFAGWVWGPWLIILLFGTHLFLTVRLGFMQRFIFRAIKHSVTKEEGGEGDVTHFAALATALAATIGTGNIIGVATAVALGGPGAILWMWLTGVFGIATKYGEAVLSVKYREQTARGEMAGGPMYVLQNGLNAKWLGVIFAIFTAIAAFGIGNMVQANAVVSSVIEHFPLVDPRKLQWGVGLALTAITAAVVLGGIKSIARVCSFLVPFMAAFYVLGCVLILIRNAAVLPETFGIIFQSAFTGHAAVGGFAGAGMMAAMRFGIARGLFSNESGMGSAPIVAAAAQTKNPVRQGLVSATGTFWDTVVICALTGLVVVSSGHWRDGVAGEGIKAATLTAKAFGDLHTVGPIILFVGLVTFVFSTILGWSYYGEKAAEYLLGPGVVTPYRILWVIAVLVGSLLKIDFVWNFADAMNGLMAVPNLIALLLLSGVIAAETKKYRSELTGRDERGGKG